MTDAHVTDIVTLVQLKTGVNDRSEVTGILEVLEPINSQTPRIQVRIISAGDLKRVLTSFMICPTDYYHFLDNKDGTFYCAFDNKNQSQRNVIGFTNTQLDLKDAMLKKIVDCFTEWRRPQCETLLKLIEKSDKESSTIRSSCYSNSSMKTERRSSISAVDISDNENGQQEGETRVLEYFNHVFEEVRRSPRAGPNQNNEEADLV
uniref:PID domain-containing protein n=1 Tax=Panagrellus redivivus TaxID=6233 RepID=A0A7E4V8E8_PANRE